MPRVITTISILALLSSLTVSAQTPASLADTTRLGEVLVIQHAKAPVNLLPLDLTVVTAEQVANSTHTTVLPVLQARVPGLFLTEQGLGGYGVSGSDAGQVSIRGVGGGDKVLFMINGQPQWAGVFGHALADTYVTSDVERVEVVSGPSSLLYGSNAMGGSVNIITRSARRDGLSGSAGAMGGSYNTWKYTLNTDYRCGPFSTTFAAQYDRSDGARDNSRFWLGNQYLSVGYDFSDHWQAHLMGTVNESETCNPGEDYAPLLEAKAHVVRENVSLSVTNDYGVAVGGIQLYWAGGQHKINDGHSADANPRGYIFRSCDSNTGFTVYQTLRPWQRANLSVGFDLKRWGGRTWYDYTSGGTPTTEEVDRHITETAGYAMLQQGLLRGRLNVNAGVRLEHSSQFGTEAVPQAGFIAHAFEGNTLKFNFSKGYRCPNLRELYIVYYSMTTDQGSFTGPCNPDLKPEYMLNYEVQIRQLMLGGRLDAGLALYFIDGKDLIQSVNRTDGPGRVFQNVGSFINKGFELDATFAIDDQWSAAASYAYLHTDTYIAYAPRNKFYLELAWRHAGWEVTVDNMNIRHLRSTETVTHSYSLLNAAVAYTFRPLWRVTPRLFVKADNVTDTRYSIIDGYPMPGITIMAGLSLKF